jgi:hypothetical protein
VKYIDHYEIEYRPDDGPWQRVAEVYPKYRWRLVRLWLLLGLSYRAKIVNNAEAAALRARCEAAEIALGLIKGDAHEQFRIWKWHHNGWWLTKEIDAEFNGSLI